MGSSKKDRTLSTDLFRIELDTVYALSQGVLTTNSNKPR